MRATQTIGMTAAIVATAVVIATTQVTGPAAPAPAQRAVASSAHGVHLELAVAQERYRPYEAIDLTTTLTYRGPEAVRRLDGTGQGLVAHTVREVYGPRVGEVGWNLDCFTFELQRDQPQAVPITKTGSYPDRDDPTRPFWDAYFDDPGLALPVGQWEIIAVARYYPAQQCEGHETWLTAAVYVTIR